MEDSLGPEATMESTENSLGPDDAGSGPNYAFIDPTAEDTMIVQIILASRTGTREVEDEPEEPAKKEEEAVKEETNDEDKENKVNGESENKEEKMEVDESKEEKTSEAEEVKEEESKEIKDDKETETKSESEDPKKEEEPKVSPTKSSEVKADKPVKKTTVEVEEFLVKFKNFSYLHCQWLTEEELLRGDKRVSAKIKRYQQKKDKSANMMDFCDDEPFNPDYVEVDRVLDSSVHTEADTNVSIVSC